MSLFWAVERLDYGGLQPVRSPLEQIGVKQAL